MGENKLLFMVVGGVLALGVLLTVILVPMSFSALEYNEYGFKRRKSTGSVDLEKVYGPGGKVLLGPDYEFKIFPATQNSEVMHRVAVFTADRLEVFLTISFQYFLNKDDLPLLHREYDIYYESVINKNALDALKRATTQFSTREFIRQRSAVEEKLFKEVKERLGGRCCAKNCQRYENCVDDCVPYHECETSDKGYFAEVRYFQLQEVDIPGDVESRFLRALVLQEETEREQFLQDAKIVEKQTDARVNTIENSAAEIAQNATAQASLIISRAESESRAMVERARSEGLQNLYRRLGLDDTNQRASFDYLRTLKDMENVHLTVDFDQMITGNFN